jgi:cytochrome b pre-mRNA-processing protein 3
MGVGDLSVGRKMRAVGEAYYGRAAAYEPGLGGADPAGLAAALGRNVYGGAPAAVAAAALAHYMIAADRAVARHGIKGLLQGTIPFPAPEDFLTAETRA